MSMNGLIMSSSPQISCTVGVSTWLKHERSGKQIPHAGEPGLWRMSCLRHAHLGYAVFVFCRLSASLSFAEVGIFATQRENDIIV